MVDISFLSLSGTTRISTYVITACCSGCCMNALAPVEPHSRFESCANKYIFLLSTEESQYVNNHH